MSCVGENLKRIFKLEELRPLQREVIEHVLSGGSALLVMPTGGGKSLTYQLPATILDGTVIVLSPLKALMKDQVDRLRGLGVRASYINSSLTRDEREQRQRELSSGAVQILYVTPERFRKQEFVSAIEKVKVPLLVVDEAHCISAWGHDFRPEYAKVGAIKAQLGNPPTLAVTATATAEVEKEILSILNIEKVFRASIRRENLALSVHDLHGMEAKSEYTVKAVRETSGPVVVYFSLIQSLHEFGRLLEKAKLKYDVYHGDMNARDRQRSQEKFLKATSGVLLATPAFGLGIDKPDIRAIIHAELPGSIEAYFQEVGRGGRDGAKATGTLLYDEDDVSIQMEFIKWSNPDREFLQRATDLIRGNPERFRQEGAEFLREELNFHNRRDYRADTVVNLLDSWGMLDNGMISGDIPEDVMVVREPRMKRLHEKLLAMVRYVKSNRCRMQYIHDYFADPLPEPCGICDNCEALRR